MPERTAAELGVVNEIIAIAAGEGDPTDLAEALLEPLRRIMPYTAAWVSLLDPQHREQPPLVCRGYPDGMAEYVAGPGGVADVEVIGLNRDSRAVRISEMRVPLEEMPTWRRFLKPAGFRDGLGAGLFTPDGRYLGVIGLHTDARDHPTPAARDLLTVLAPTIARALDPLRALSAAALIVRGARAGVVVSRSGGTLPLPGLPDHPVLRPGSPVLAAACRHLADQEFATFLCPHRDGEIDPYLRITVLRRTSPAPRHLVGAAVLSPPGPLYGLSGIQLRMLGHLVEDRPPERMAAALGLPPPAVAAHLDAIPPPLGDPNLTKTVLRALRLGLYIPPELATARS